MGCPSRAGTAGEQDVSRPLLPSGGWMFSVSGPRPLMEFAIPSKEEGKRSRNLCRSKWPTQYRVRKVERILTMLPNNQLQLTLLFILALHEVPRSTHNGVSQRARGTGSTSSENLQTRQVNLRLPGHMAG